MSELFFSEKNNFFTYIQKYILSINQELLIISPFIKKDVLDLLLKNCHARISIITTWNIRDLQLGISDIQLYQYCKERGISLFLNPRIHLKAFIGDYSSCIFGSANISEKGLAITQNYNFELNGKIETLNPASIFYFKKILFESILVDEGIVKLYQQAIDKMQPLPIAPEPNIDLTSRKSEFLISALPMSFDIKQLFEIYSNQYMAESREARDCAIHDIILYNLPTNLPYSQFRTILKERFFSSRFIQKLLEFISDDGRYFGEVKTWIQQNCEDVPVPSRRDLTGNIQVLYRWIVDLSDGEYKVDRPHHSERLYKVKP